MIWLIGLFIVRLASLRPALIDDDEAWFSASARALHNPFKFYLLTPDNKPPGTVWFYWLLGGDPVIARLTLIFLTSLCAYLVYRICLKIGRSSSVAKTSASLFLCSSAFFPKLFAVTNEGLILILSTAMLSIWLLAIHRRKIPPLGLCIASGLLGATILLVKQTSFVYVLPVFFAFYTLKSEQGFRKSAFVYTVSLLVPFALLVLFLGPHEFFFWNFSYAAGVLTQARRGLFSEFKELMISLVVFLIAVSPLLLNFFRNRGKSATDDFLTIWFVSALCAALAGWGLFLHYFIPLVAPLCYGSALDAWKTKRAVGFATALYGLSAFILLVPNSTTFFGTDLFYYGRLADRIQKISQPEDNVFIWGLNPIPLALSSRSSIPGFLTTRFAVGPYASAELTDRFHEAFVRILPRLFVDLHEKHDNRFRLNPHSIGWLDETLRARYEALSDPSLPWVSFYRLKDSNSGATLQSVPESEDPVLKTIHLQNLSSLFFRPLLWPASFRLAREVDPIFRAWMGFGLLPSNSDSSALGSSLKTAVLAKVAEINSLADNGVAPLSSPESSQNFSDEVAEAFKHHDWDRPLPLEGRAWWVSLALTELQP